MADLRLLSPTGDHAVDLLYAGEPPHGDSYHEAFIRGARLPGFVWGGMFAFTPDGRFLAGGWMPQLFERHTNVVDLIERRYFVLPVYIADFTFRWPVLSGVQGSAGSNYTFDGGEVWMSF